MPEKCFIEIENEINPVYVIPDDKFIEKFVNPVLKRTKIYKRLTYSFSSGILQLISGSLSDIIKNDCKLFYITGIELKPDDVESIGLGLEYDADFFLQKQIEREFGRIEAFIDKLKTTKNKELLYRHRLRVLSYLVAKKIINIKVGLRINNGKVADPSHFKFHPKVMIYEDFDNHILVCNGSSNESIAGQIENAETLTIFKNWVSGQSEFSNFLVKLFDEYWSNNNNFVKTLPVDKIIENQLNKKYKPNFNSKEEIIEIENTLQHLVEEETQEDSDKKQEIKETLRPYQIEIIENWFKEGKKGIYKMATGTGKTKTAIYTIKRFLEEKPNSIILITCPYIALIEQWIKELSNYNIIPLSCYGGKDSWESALKNYLLDFKLNPKGPVYLITTGDNTLCDDSFQEILKPYWNKTFIIADECHHFQNESLNAKLNRNIPYRLGLSATPEDDVDDEKNKRLYSFFIKNIPPEYDLARALKEEYLEEYNYKPIITELTDPLSLQRYEEVINELSKIRENFDSEEYEKLINKRDELLDECQEKGPKLDKLLEQLGDKLSHCIIYCADGKNIRDSVRKILYQRGITFAEITAEVRDPEERKRNLRMFKEGFIKVLLGIRILDEGLDMPAVNTAIILKSSLSSRQSVQRRGRCLRLLFDENNKVIKKDVNIYDLLVLPEIKFGSESLYTFNVELLQRELKRIEEFVSLAKNSDEAKKIINERIRYV